jgi:maleylpyruvate isomerase
VSSLDTARQALRERQGPGARYDSQNAPADSLRLARLGTAYFARALASVTDEELYRPARSQGWTRAEVAVDVAYHARALCRQLEAVAADMPPPPMYDGLDLQFEEIALGGSLPARAIRHLSEHAAIHLDVVWRDLPNPSWRSETSDELGRPRPLSRTADERASVVWLGAIDLGAARIGRLPRHVHSLLTGEPRRNLTAAQNARTRKDQ